MHESNSLFLPGNALVGQSGGPTAAINATLSGVIRGMANTSSTLYGMRNGIQGFMEERLVDLTAFFSCPDGTLDEKKLKTLEHTPAAALGSCRKKLPDPDSPDGATTYEKLIGLFEKYNIHTFFYIGGNDSMDTVAKLSAYTARVGYPLAVMGVPKTIDNDLEGTDHTPGYASAAKYVATTIQEIIRDCAVYTVPAVTIVEIMGRDAGWLTAASALGRVVTGYAPDYVYLPEVDFSMECFFADVRAALAKHPNVVIAVSEGIHLADGTLVGATGNALDVFGHPALSGAGKALELAVKAEIGCKVRSVELNIPQRCASQLLSRTDIEESVRVGEAAVHTVCAGMSGQMMTICRVSDCPYTSEILPKPVSEIANKVRKVPTYYINRENNNVTDDCCRYLLPLIKGETAPEYVDGLPRFLVLPDKE